MGKYFAIWLTVLFKPLANMKKTASSMNNTIRYIGLKIKKTKDTAPALQDHSPETYMQTNDLIHYSWHNTLPNLVNLHNKPKRLRQTPPPLLSLWGKGYLQVDSQDHTAEPKPNKKQNLGVQPPNLGFISTILFL